MSKIRFNRLVCFLPSLFSKKVFMGIVAFVLLGSCHSNKNPKKVSETAATKNSVKTPSIQQPLDTSLIKLNAFKGQYPSDVKLLDQPELKPRLKALLGSQYENFRKYWQTETPIEIEDSVLSTTGCEEHNCAANQFVLQIDLVHNNINVYHFGETIQSYLEKGPIHLPPGLANEFQNITVTTNNH